MKSILATISTLSLNLMLFLSSSAWADNNAAVPPAPGGATAPVAAPQAGFASMVLPFALMFAVVYFLMIRPQQKKMKEQQAVLESLKHGDEVLTASGILGKITGITDKVVTLEVADGVRVKMLKSQITQVIKGQINDLA